MKHNNALKSRKLKVRSKRFVQIALALILPLSFSFSTAHAQEAVPATGGDASGSGGSASYSVGQVFYNTNTGTNEYSLAEGVQQPYEISIVTGIDDASGIELECTIYPNPTRDVLTLKVKNYDRENLSYQLFNMSGNLLKSKKLRGDKTAISMAGLVRATYFLKIIENQKRIKVFKIIKN
ncbi:MAG: T9SS type A sorting domain-containing protein [Bacteroidales bacterium]|nr:T9SS type A sorting domain-containing protein [Bacteroidales bacterium]